ncbi:MAG: kelch repeat-containing protein, partial [Actinomycetota bacterium]
YQLLFSGGTASFANVPVVADGLFGRITLALYIGPGANPLVGTVTNIYPDTTTFLGSGINAAGRAIADGMSMTLAYTSNRIDLSGLTYAHDPSNMIIREMIFSDQLSFTPSTTRWDFNPISMGMPLFSFTSMVTPAADMLFAGGRNCGLTAPAVYGNCIRTRPAPSVSSPTFTALTYSNAYIGEFEGTWPAAPMMTGKRAFHTSTVLPDSSILTCGGSQGATTLQSCELLPPNSGAWLEVSSMTAPRALHTATLLPNGAVLVTGGTAGSSTAALNTAELFSPNSGRWVPVQSMAVARQNHTANLLPNGDVLIAGGAGTGSYLDSAEIYKTTAAAWQNVATAMNAPRTKHVAVNMKDGNILMIGGTNGSGATTSVDRYNYPG